MHLQFHGQVLVHIFFSLLGKIIMKLINDIVERAILVVPFWPAQSWFSSLIMSLLRTEGDILF
jgi:hypothetical protein